MILTFVANHIKPNTRNHRFATSQVIHALQAAAAAAALAGDDTQAQALQRQLDETRATAGDEETALNYRREAAAAKAAGDKQKARDLKRKAQEADAEQQKIFNLFSAQQEAARVAAEQKTKALAFQKEADVLFAGMLINGVTLAQPTAPDRKTKPSAFDTKLIALQWQPLSPGNRPIQHEAPGVLILNYTNTDPEKPNGCITFTPTAFTLSGNLATNPRAILLAVRHAQLHWGAKMVVSGSEETRLQFAVAARMLGVKTNLFDRIPKYKWVANILSDRHARHFKRAQQLSTEWQPILDDMLGRPSTPSAPARPSPSTAGVERLRHSTA